jgi:hypothetical protein
MSEGISEKDKRQILNGLLRLKKDIDAINKKKDDADKMLEKYEEHNFKYYLNKKNTEDLHELRKALDVRNASKFKKCELIDVLSISIIKKLEYILNNLWVEDINLIRKILSAGGALKINDATLMNMLDIWSIGSIEDMDGINIAIIPVELRKELEGLLRNKNLIKHIEIKQYCFNIVKGKLYYYGVLEVSQIYEIIKDLKVSIDENEVITYIFNNSNCGRGIEVDYNIVSHEHVLEPEGIYNEQQCRDIDYIEVSDEKAFNASKDGFYEWNEYHKEFNKYLIKRFNQTIMRAADIVNQCDFKVKNGYSFGQIIHDLSMEIEIPDLATAKELANLIQDIYNNTSMWVLKGHSPRDMRTKEKKHLNPTLEAKKVGRNDACPCGSGKKYKNCCLSME